MDQPAAARDSIVKLADGVFEVSAARYAMDLMAVMGLALLLLIVLALLIVPAGLSVFDIGFMGENAFTISVTAGLVLLSVLLALVCARAIAASCGKPQTFTVALSEEGLFVDGKRLHPFRESMAFEREEVSASIPVRAKAMLLPMMLIWLGWSALFGRVLPDVIAGPIHQSLWVLKVNRTRVPLIFFDERTAGLLEIQLNAHLEDITLAIARRTVDADRLISVRRLHP